MKDYHEFVKKHGKTAWKRCVKGWSGSAVTTAKRIFKRAYPKRTAKEITAMAHDAIPLMQAMQSKRLRRQTEREVRQYSLQERRDFYLDDIGYDIVRAALHRYECGIQHKTKTVSSLKDCNLTCVKHEGWKKYGRKGSRKTIVAVGATVTMLKGVKTYSHFITNHGMAVLGAVRTGTEFGCEVWDAVVAHRVRGGCSVDCGYVVRCDNWAGFARTHKHAKSLAYKFRFHHTLETEFKDVWDDAQTDKFMRKSIVQVANEIAAAC